ncbi:lipase family protein [Pseudoalteromonas sp. C2R02]|uniref:lipase family protein n=1 Tax=Pseudoalteromonas sp. C2R02 TaxID=2841565 RepID=UPI001C08B48F|nr:lipase family protein [Pseudoalteromonas sp. C2R02]MBU2972512.1 lipase family protein [Pseudoalteromonas sp. C2R02]
MAQVKKTGNYSGHTVIALRGTANKRDAVTDMHCGLSTSANNLPAHAGFNKTFNSIRPVLNSYFTQNNTGPVHCVGHSLGGALANLTANWLHNKQNGRPISLYTFGAPRVGYASFADKTSNGLHRVFRCLHTADPVPLLPFWPFVHTEGEYTLNAAPTISANAHKMAGNAPGYTNTASAFKSFAAVNKRNAHWHKEQVRLDYEKRHQASFTSKWAHRLGAALITLLRDTGYLYEIQHMITSGLTFYDKIALYLTKVANMPGKFAEQQRGLLGHMLVFAGKRGVEITEMSYKFIRWVLSVTLDKVALVAGHALSMNK